VASARTAHSESNKSGSNEPSTYRLVIRAEIIPEETPETTVPLHSNRRWLALVVGGLVVLLALSWVGISVFRTDSASMPNPDERAQDATLQLPAPVSLPSEPVPAASTAPAPPATSTPATASAAASPSEAKSVELEAQTKRNALPSPIKEVIPDVPRSALQTIRGTIRVSVRVTVDKPGTVVAATSEVSGPSRYFERLAIDAARKWTFAPDATEEQRRMLVQFSFTRGGVTARTNPVR
jgi:TonB family protein